MGFWTGLLTGVTGHQPGAFKGFGLKDILDEDMWEMRERKFPSPIETASAKRLARQKSRTTIKVSCVVVSLESAAPENPDTTANVVTIPSIPP